MLRPTDITSIKTSLDELQKKSEDIKLRKYEPTLNTLEQIYQDIYQFARDNKLIIYGGWAQNHLIKIKNPKDAFYHETSLADIEFYSYEPIQIGMKLTDLLCKKNYNYVSLQEGIHQETYKLFVDFHNFCDISYMPKYIYDNLPVIKSQGLLLTHPNFMTVDAFRVYTDPMFSFWRIEKTFTRFNTLLKYYPIFDKNIVGKKINYEHSIDNEVSKFIKHNILHNSELIVIHHHAYNYYIKKTNNNQFIIDIPYFSFISVNYTKDIQKITKTLEKQFPNKIKIIEYYPFFQFVGRKTEFFLNDKKILVIYSHNARCTTYQALFSENKKTLFGTFSLIRLMFLAEHFNFSIHKNPTEANNFLILMNNLFSARIDYLEDKDITVIDNSPFQEFTFECIGDAIDPIRQSRLNVMERIKQGKKIKFIYDPTNKDKKIPDINFANTSGNPIKNPKDLTINK